MSQPKSIIFFEEDILIKPKQKNNNAILLIFIVIIIIIIIAFFIKNNLQSQSQYQNYQTSSMPFFNQLDMQDIIPSPQKINTDPLQIIQDPYPIDKIYYSDQVDPIVTGNLYQNVNNLRPVYTQRTAFGLPKWDTQYASANGNFGPKAPTGQLTEFNSSGASGDVGVTIGPIVFPTNYDDGIPSEWDLPSTPMLSFYESHIPTADYYDPTQQAAIPYSLKGFNIPFEQDNSILIN